MHPFRAAGIVVLWIFAIYGGCIYAIGIAQSMGDIDKVSKGQIMTETNIPPVKGYRPLTVEAVELVNGNKQTEEQILRMLDLMQQEPTIDKRWLAIGRTHIELAFMAINRSIFKPERVGLPGDDPAGDKK